MPHNRFFVETDLREGVPVSLCDHDLHYFRKVLRKKVGDTIELVNGKGYLATATVDSVSKETLSCSPTKVFEQKKSEGSSILVLGLLRQEHLELAVEKAVEIGVESIVLFIAERSEKKNLTDNNLRRLRLIMQGALKQCGSLFMPELLIKKNLQEALDQTKPIYYGDFTPDAKIVRALDVDSKRTIQIVIGPESGLSDNERAFLQKNATSFCLSKNTFRAETAAICALHAFDICHFQE